MKKLARLLLCGIFIFCALSLYAQIDQQPIERYEVFAKKILESINNNDYAIIEEDFNEEMKKAFPEEKAMKLFTSLKQQLGKIVKIGQGKIVLPNQAVFPIYFEKVAIILDMKVVLNEKDEIIGLWFFPHTPEITVPEKNSSVLSLPFKEEWYVFWGGDNKSVNHHFDIAMQRYAIDFVIMDEMGKTYKDSGKKNEDYYAFGKEILSPGDGTITDVIIGVQDNLPGSMNPYSALGNAVIIKHREYEYSVIAHFKYNSIFVKVGDEVKLGQILGLCGNSGNSSEPHIHYHLQNTNILQNGTGIKCFFDKVSVSKDSQTKNEENYFPVKGDKVKKNS